VKLESGFVCKQFVVKFGFVLRGGQRIAV